MRVALTGGATGIGAGGASKLTARGHMVMAFDISEPLIAAAINAANEPFDALINNA